MYSILDAAQRWHNAGVSTIPILANGTKKPAISWGEFQFRIPEQGHLDQWWANGKQFGLALICGRVSGNLEMTEIEAAGIPRLFDLEEKFRDLGVFDVWDTLTRAYLETSPAGGIHLLYRISDAPVPGNTKIAHTSDGKVLAETRGDGGYVIVAPTTGLCHPSGTAWVLEVGEPGVVPSITMAERNLLHEAIRATLDETGNISLSSSMMVTTPPQTPAPVEQVSPVLLAPGAGLRPGETWAAGTSWRQILEPAGYTFSHRHGVEEYWTRPGKSVRDGHSVTTNYMDSDLLKVFSSSIPGLITDATYTKFGAFAAIYHNGDWDAATKELVRQGFGTSRVPAVIDDVHTFEPESIVDEKREYLNDDAGMAQRLQEWRTRSGYRVGEVFRMVAEEKKPRMWNGTTWVTDDTGAVIREYWDCTQAMLRSQDGETAKAGTRYRNQTRQAAAVKNLWCRGGMTVKAGAFDRDRHLVNLRNGILDLDQGQLLPHDPKYLMTRMFGAKYDPQATCPNFTRFMEQVLPDPELRAYVQRAAGYTMLGDADQRAMFLVHGPSGTGKSTFLETLQAVFGDYAGTAAPGTFRAKDFNGSATPELHGLRGKRFVATSETTETARFDEESLKRLTGRDRVTSRRLYEDFQEWVPECSLWMATNHPPRFTSDDTAIWNRAKLIPFETEFLGVGEIRDMARRVLIPEADGILNWLLEGLVSYLELGSLAEPAAVTATASALREQSDSVIRFLDEKVLDSVLEFGEGRILAISTIYQMYMEWSRSSGDKAVGRGRFNNRIDASGRNLKISGANVVGVGRVTGSSVLGTFGWHQ